MKGPRQPTSVSEMLNEEFLKPLSLTQRQFADHISVEVKTNNRLVNSKSYLSSIMALKLSAALGTTPEFWMNLQVANDLWLLKNTQVDLPKVDFILEYKINKKFKM
jgi:addiction module HigA family antidote